MTDAPQTLARPLASRIADLPPPQTQAEEASPNPLLLEGAVEALAAGKTKYTDRPGIVGLRQWVANHLNQLGGLDLSADQVTVTCGIEEARFVAVTYLEYDGQTQFAAKFDTLQTEKVIYLQQQSAQVQEILDAATGQHIIWELSVHEPSIDHIIDRNLTDRTLFVGSFPGVGDGWRVGWMAGHTDHAKLRSYKQSMTICTPSASQWAVLNLLEAGS
jgi:DNA-binding transcriptional MocR family regulator